MSNAGEQTDQKPTAIITVSSTGLVAGWMVIDKETGREADIESIALNEEWAKRLVYCDMEGWYLGQDGELMLADECGCHAYPPANRFEVVPKTATVKVSRRAKEQES